MKNVSEFNKHDLELACEHAEQLAMAYIEHKFSCLHDCDEVFNDEMHGVKCAVAVLKCIKDMKAAG